MIYLLCALEAEVPHLKLPDGMTLVLTGVGKVNAAYIATKIASADDCTQILNYGTAGTLDAQFAGQLLRVKEIRQRDMDAEPLVALGDTPFDLPEVSSALKIAEEGVVLSTGDNFVRARPEIASDLVDMEAYAIAKVCAREGVPFTCYKYVTDLADENASENWRDNVAAGQAAFQNLLNTEF
ncbi:MAG: 5'-methylthioadenosine nucleosidase [Pseudomonadota bacterium]